MILLSLSFVLALLTSMNVAYRPKFAPLTRVRNRLWTVSALLSSSSSAAVASGNIPSALSAYDVINKFDVKEYGLSGTRYQHRKSGAEVLSIKANDDNKVFGITFRTPPADSTGVAHILEHSVLCGSRKYPTKEPFAHLLKSSLQNFLNAFTYPDRTCYPVASTNTKDFYNLINVYMDAVLHPRAINNEQVFRQEGWHYELDSTDAPLQIKGVVYNEMKGVYGDPSALLGRAVHQSLFPDNAYGVDSGGDPLKIPNLSFEQFKQFHSSYYHPSNSRIFFYGDDDEHQRLAVVDEYLREFDAAPHTAIASQVQFQKKRLVPFTKQRIPYPADPDAQQGHMLTVNWMLNEEALTLKDTLLLGIMDHLLLGTPSAALRKVLTESQLGEKVIGGGLSDELLQSTFSVGLKGVKRENVDTVEKLVLSTLEHLAQKGFDADAIEASVNTCEFRLREFNTGSFPRGLSAMLGMMSRWIYNGTPEDALRFEEPLQAIKRELKQGKPIFQDLLKRYLSTNSHRIAVEMIPDSELEANQKASDEKRFADLKNSMSDGKITEIMQSVELLRAAQLTEDTPEAKSSLPALELADIEKEVKIVPRRIMDHPHAKEVTVLAHDLETSGIVYVDAVFDYSTVKLEDVELLPLYARMLLESGTEDKTDVELSRELGTHTGGISISFHNDLKYTPGKVANLDEPLLYLVMHSKAVSDKVPTLFDLMGEVLLSANLNNQQKAIELLKQSKSSLEASVRTSGHALAASRLSQDASLLGYMGEKTGGLTAVRAAGKLLESAQNNWPATYMRLQNIHKEIVKRRGAVVNLTANKEKNDMALASVSALLEKLPNAGLTLTNKVASLVSQWKASVPSAGQHVHRMEGFEVPTQVNYVVKAGNIMAPGSPVSGSDSVVTRYLSTGFLWDSVRVVGGAYGGFCRFSDVTGRFSFLSYRDPNIVDTLNVYDRAAKVLKNIDVKDEELTQTIVGAISDISRPLQPDQKGWSSLAQYLSGETDADRQRWREEVLATSKDDFKSFAKKLEKLQDEGSVAVFGSKQALERANELLGEKKLALESALPAEVIVDAVKP